MKFYNWFFKGEGVQKHWVQLVNVFIPLIFTVWGTYIAVKSYQLSVATNDNREQINLIMKQIDYLQKIYGVNDSTNRTIQNLKELPQKLSYLGNVLDTLNLTVREETKKLGLTYSKLNVSYEEQIAQQKDYLDKISKVVELSNVQIKELAHNNEIINKEFSRRINFSVKGILKKKNGLYYLDHLILMNNGSIECNVISLGFVMPDNFICNDSLSKGLPAFMVYEKAKNVLKLNTDMELNRKGVNGNESLFLDTKCDCYFKSKKDIQILYLLSFNNKYESNSIPGEVILEEE